MKEKLTDMKNKIITEVEKVDVLKRFVDFIKANRMVSAIVAFCVVAVTMLVMAVFQLQEFVVSVCILIVIEAAMAALLHKVELWKHGVLLVAQIVVGVLVKNIPLVAICVVLYVAATATLSFMKEA